MATALSTPSFADCHIEAFRFFFGSDTSTSGTVSSGSNCTIRPGAGRNAGFSSIAVTTPAKHGSATTNGSIFSPEVYYKPKAGYKGSDDFVFTITGGGARLQGPSNIHVTMDVQ
jgi:hypothetical protein